CALPHSLHCSTFLLFYAPPPLIIYSLSLHDALPILLPVSYNPDNQGRATVGAAKTLLAKVYLTRERWQQAADKAREVIDSGTYRDRKSTRLNSQSRFDLVCRLLLEKKNNKRYDTVVI